MLDTVLLIVIGICLFFQAGSWTYSLIIMVQGFLKDDKQKNEHQAKLDQRRVNTYFIQRFRALETRQKALEEMVSQDSPYPAEQPETA